MATRRSDEWWTLLLGLAGALLCYLAQPPASLSWLAWIGPVPWILLVQVEKLAGRRPYRALWVAGFFHWLVTLQWLRLAHPANYGAWLLIAAYLGCYLPTFVALARIAVHRARVPVWIAAPVVWTGLEWIRARFLTGFLMASLAHTQVRNSTVIQIADLAGEYAVTFLIMLVAATIAAALPLKWVRQISAPGSAQGLLGSGDGTLVQGETYPRAEPGAEGSGRLSWARLLPAALAIGAAAAYGRWRLQIEEPAKGPPSDARIALIQSDMVAEWKGDDARDEKVMQQQMELSHAAAADAMSQGKPLDLIVWPETMFRQPLFVPDKEHPPAPGVMADHDLLLAERDLVAVVKETGAPLLVGIDRVEVSQVPGTNGNDQLQFVGHNAAVCVGGDGAFIGAYDKMHLLPFGEYVPLADWIPWLRLITPVTGSALAGDGGIAFDVGGVRYSPNICYETVLPQVMRAQWLSIVKHKGKPPDVLVNLTNDAWYWGSSELDMHLASGVFRAIEFRRPLVIAANRGLSASVDRFGNIARVSERNKPAYFLCDVDLPSELQSYPTLYVAWGDWLPLGCLLATIATVAVGRRWGVEASLPAA